MKKRPHESPDCQCVGCELHDIKPIARLGDQVQVYGLPVLKLAGTVELEGKRWTASDVSPLVGTITTGTITVKA